MIRLLGVNRVQTDRGPNAFGIFLGKLQRGLGSVSLRPDIYNPNIIFQGALQNFLPIVLESRELNVSMYVKKSHGIRGKSGGRSFTTNLFHSDSRSPSAPKISRILPEVSGKNGESIQASETAP